MKLTFLGAAQQVTGSMFLLETNSGYKILVDCGADMERRSGYTNDQITLNPTDVDVVLLTHAHLDHTGALPDLLHAGYQGQILATAPTIDLTSIIIKDSLSIRASRKKSETSEESNNSILEELDSRFVPIAFNKKFELNDHTTITFYPAGHLLGAAHILIEVKEENEWKRILFSGDIGRKNYPLLPDPAKLPEVDYLVCETTYGDRQHQDEYDAEEFLYDIIMRNCVDVKGRVLIPSFSVGRTQSLLYTIQKLHIRKKLPDIRVFADSPMAEACSRVYVKHNDQLNQEARNISSHSSLFNFENLNIIKSFKESREIADYSQPCIIISSSGMLTGGRMEHHIKRNLKNPYCSILMVGYAPEGTPGFDLLHKKFFQKGEVLANIQKTDLFSGHADHNGLIDFVSSTGKRLKKIFLVHGEYSSMVNFKKTLSTLNLPETFIPARGEVAVL